MRHKHNRLLRLLPQSQQLLVQLVADNLIQRAERLVHQQQIGIK